ncbi:hypothetical protein JCM5353_004593 [Sporobolomyces roseus]
MLSSYFPTARKSPVTSRVSYSYSKPSPWTRSASPASRIRAKEVFYKDDDRRFGHQRAWPILEEPLILCPAESGAPSSNRANQAAIKLGYHRAKVSLSSWFSKIPPALSTAYATKLRDSKFLVPVGKQSGRVHRSEDDVGDSLLVNVILPVVEILNRLIDPGLQQDLLIIPTREASASAGKSPSTDTSTSISLDHAIQLVSRRVYNYHKPPSVKIYLAIIEEKVLCHILLLTVGTQAEAIGRTILPSAPPETFDAFNSGLRHALCMLGVDALRELGILRQDIFELDHTLQPFPPKVVSLLKAARGQIDNLHYTDTVFEERGQIPGFASALQDPELLYRRQERQARQAPNTFPPPFPPPTNYYAPSMPVDYSYR